MSLVGGHDGGQDGGDGGGNDSQVVNTRVGRLLRERELKESLRSTVSSIIAGPDGSALEIGTGYDSSGSHDIERSSEGASVDGLRESADGRPIRQRLLVVANRLPVFAVRRDDDSWSLEISAGGLVSALVGVKEFETRWIGWAGMNVSDEAGQMALTKALAEKKCVPVFLDEVTGNEYNDYSNNILWPLFHYLGLPHEDRLATTRSIHQTQFAAYKMANRMFADVVCKHYEDGDIIWCLDYHLMFLPKFLKEYNSNIKVGWFLHTHFPSSEMHRTLPSLKEVLHAVLAADLVGFHINGYARHFVSACTRILGVQSVAEGVEDQERTTRVAAFPIGIDAERFIHALEVPQVKRLVDELKAQFARRKVMMGVDHLDMIKGIPQNILAFEKFLEENSDWHDKVVLLQIVVPTRTDVAEYQKLTSQVHEFVGRINDRFGNLTSLPIHYLDHSLDFNALCALYAIADVALVTSLHDGMNLASYEFVACQSSKKGVLILNKFAGAAQSLVGALLVNPWNIIEVSNAIGQALTMPAEEREECHWYNFKRVTSHTAQQWAESFISNLNDTAIEAKQRIRKISPALVFSEGINAYWQSENRFLILGGGVSDSEEVEQMLASKDTLIYELTQELAKSKSKSTLDELERKVKTLSSENNILTEQLSEARRVKVLPLPKLSRYARVDLGLVYFVFILVSSVLFMMSEPKDVEVYPFAMMVMVPVILAILMMIAIPLRWSYYPCFLVREVVNVSLLLVIPAIVDHDCDWLLKAWVAGNYCQNVIGEYL
ncbi:trehalose-6-phosphate synthase, partial [Striga asiatica]